MVNSVTPHIHAHTRDYIEENYLGSTLFYEESYVTFIQNGEVRSECFDPVYSIEITLFEDDHFSNYRGFHEAGITYKKISEEVDIKCVTGSVWFGHILRYDKNQVFVILDGNYIELRKIRP